MPPPATPQTTTPSWHELASERRERNTSTSGDSLIQRGIENVADRRNRQENHPMSMFNKLDLDLPNINNNPHSSPDNRFQNPGLISSNEIFRSDEAGPSQMPELIPVSYTHLTLPTILLV